jgi:hypothetical protein
MKIQIPEDLKNDVPQGFWGKVLSATPIVMTVVATALAGLASSEMTKAQYDRALAAQQQSKAGDQWGLFQAKRLRGALQRSTLDLLQNTAEVRPLDVAAVVAAAAPAPAPGAPASPPAKKARGGMPSEHALGFLLKGELPVKPHQGPSDPVLKSALEGVENGWGDADVAPLLAKVEGRALETALRVAMVRVQTFDAAMAPVLQAIERHEAALNRAPPGGALPPRALARDFTAARLRFSALRYDAEARLNQSIALLYELQVRKSNVSAERHHVRSQRFFFGMLAAQAAVIISTFALAARKRSLLWSLAAAGGVAAVSFAAWVYLFV